MTAILGTMTTRAVATGRNRAATGRDRHLNECWMSKAPRYGADALILDLED